MSVQKWEYKCQFILFSKTEHELNELGGQGWELVFVFQNGFLTSNYVDSSNYSSLNRSGAEYLFKRKKKS